jgi:glycine cleavage system H protein
MVEVRDDLKYTKTHEWARIEGNRVRVGITDYAQGELTDIVYVELPEVGKEIKAGDIIAVVESVKSTSDTYSPVSGTVVEVNEELENAPETMNTEPYGDGWLAVIECGTIDDKALLSPEDYRKILAK